MLPLPLLIGLILALGMRDLGRGAPPAPDRAVAELPALAAAAGAWAAAVILVGLAIGLVLAARRSRPGATRLGRAWARLVEWSAVGLFAWALFDRDWAGVAVAAAGVDRAILIDELAILAPFLLMQVVAWLATYPAERALGRGGRGAPSLRDHVGLRLRQCLGMLLPLVVMYGLGHDLMERWAPAARDQPAAQLGMLAAMSSAMLLLSPLFVRISWRTRRLESGPLRRRLERVSRRFGFRCSDILVWETGGRLVNAGVTGALPWYRYVILTDGLIERLAPREIEAVFGHELGHIKHRHLAFFGFFFIGSVGALSLVEAGLNAGFGSGFWTGLWGGGSIAATVAEWAILGAVLGAYILLVFGHLSRRFERQADLFGCQVVSCDRVDCPPHADLDGGEAPATTVPTGVCPVGIEIFSKALREVASSNGLPLLAPSWRHGSIAHRLGFLERAADHPEVVPRFQRSVWRLRLGLGLVLGALLLASLWKGPAGP
jgi:STE24 endopeptidase